MAGNVGKTFNRRYLWIVSLCLSFFMTMAASEQPSNITIVGSADECARLQPGDIQMLSFNSRDPDEIYFIALTNILSSVGSIYVTVDSWNGTGFEGYQGTARFQIPDTTYDFIGGRGLCDGICELGKFFFNASMLRDNGTAWFPLEEGLPLFELDETSGATVMTYCLTHGDEPHFLHAMTFSWGGWLSVVPSSLVGQHATLELPYARIYDYNNFYFKEYTTDELDQVKREMTDPANWSGLYTRRESNESWFTFGWMLLLQVGCCAYCCLIGCVHRYEKRSARSQSETDIRDPTT